MTGITSPKRTAMRRYALRLPMGRIQSPGPTATRICAGGGRIFITSGWAEAGSPQSIAAAVTQLLSSTDDQLAAQGLAASRQYQTHFSEQAVRSSLQALITSVCPDRNASGTQTPSPVPPSAEQTGRVATNGETPDREAADGEAVNKAAA